MRACKTRYSRLAHEPDLCLSRINSCDGLVTATVGDHACEVIHDVERTGLIMRQGQGCWRVVSTWGDGGYGRTRCRAIPTCQFGPATPIPAMLPMSAPYVMRGVAVCEAK